MKNLKSSINKYHKGISISLTRFAPKGYKSGFTLIETLVSLALFSIVLVIAGGTIVSVIDVNKRNQAISSVVNNLNYSIDSMIRDVKTGYLYKCNYDEAMTIDDIKRSTALFFTDGNVDGICTNLTLISTISGIHTVVKYEFIPAPGNGENGYIKKSVYDASGALVGAYSITDKTNVQIDNASFNVTLQDPLECENAVCNYGQPFVFVVIKGKAGNQAIEVSKFYVQTLISQRLINITDFKD